MKYCLLLICFCMGIVPVPAQSLNVTNPVALATPLLNESSGIVYIDGALWTHNDSGNQPAIYRISESNGSVLQTVNITNATNSDWEDITADAQYIYIGDFGNNANGIRTNLRIYRISKADITEESTVNVTASIINFSYSDQVIGASPGSNNTEFDCESFFIKDNVLHLFSKDWVNGNTKHYQLSATPGTYVISPVETAMHVDGLITSADITANNYVVLVGYNKSNLKVFMYLLYNYTGTTFMGGNNTRIDVGTMLNIGSIANSMGQVEAVTMKDNVNGYLTSERLTVSSFTVPARLYSFSISSFVSLPVQLGSFTAAYQYPDILLQWNTLSEHNSAYFTIERSTDGIHFSSIGKKQAMGLSDNTHHYQFIDKQPAAINYYRLKQVDIDGAEKLYDIKMVKVPAKNDLLQAHFISSQLMIKADGTKNDGKVFKLFTVSGSLIKTGMIHSSVQFIDLPGLTKGMYILVVDDIKKGPPTKVILCN